MGAKHSALLLVTLLLVAITAAYVPVQPPRQAPKTYKPPVPITPPPPPPPPPTLPFYGQGPPVKKEDCLTLCKKRCALHYKRVCVRTCTTCCKRCKCVPPGPYAKKEVCGRCYTEMTTHGGRPKCP